MFVGVPDANALALSAPSFGGGVPMTIPGVDAAALNGAGVCFGGETPLTYETMTQAQFMVFVRLFVFLLCVGGGVRVCLLDASLASHLQLIW